MNKRNMCLVAAAAAMVAMAPTLARADSDTSGTTTSMSTTTTTTTEFVPINIPTVAPAPTGPNGEPINYTVLTGKSYDYVDLNQARAEGFTDHDIAVLAKIADKSGMPFNTIKHEALNGMAYPTIADRYNLRLADVLDVPDYEQQIAEYRVAYETTGENAVRNLVAASREEMGTYTTTTRSTTVNSNANLLDVIDSRPELSTFARAIRQANLTSLLNGPGPLTIFAPTDAAFAKLSNDQLNALMNNRDELVKVLDYHIIPQRIDAAQASSMTSPTSPATLEGDSLQVTTSNGTVMINGATTVTPDVFATNGVIHEIDTVLVPTGITVGKTSSKPAMEAMNTETVTVVTPTYTGE